MFDEKSLQELLGKASKPKSTTHNPFPKMGVDFAKFWYGVIFIHDLIEGDVLRTTVQVANFTTKVLKAEGMLLWGLSEAALVMTLNALFFPTVLIEKKFKDNSEFGEPEFKFMLLGYVMKCMHVTDQETVPEGIDEFWSAEGYEAKAKLYSEKFDVELPATKEELIAIIGQSGH